MTREILSFSLLMAPPPPLPPTPPPAQKREANWLNVSSRKDSGLHCSSFPLSGPSLTGVPSFQFFSLPPSSCLHSIPSPKIQFKCCLLQEAFPDPHRISESISPSLGLPCHYAPLSMQLLKFCVIIRNVQESRDSSAGSKNNHIWVHMLF